MDVYSSSSIGPIAEPLLRLDAVLTESRYQRHGDRMAASTAFTKRVTVVKGLLSDSIAW